MLLAVFLFGLATIGFGLSQVFWLSILCLMVMGAADMVSVIVRQTLIQLHTPDALRGRVSAVSQVFIGASNELGEFESGLTAAWFGLQRAIVLGGIGTCVIALSWTRFFPELRAADRLDQP
jgi:MFS family permease